MNPKKQVPRRRCTMCRKWYRPDPRTFHHQKTCGSKCRGRRRRWLARKRREQDLDLYREDERHRQRVCRARRREADGQGGGFTAVDPSRSRAGIILEVIELEEEILEIWDKSVGLSRSWLKRQLVQTLKDTAKSWDKVGQKRCDVTNRLDCVNDR